MIQDKDKRAPTIISEQSARGAGTDHSLLPMLLWGLAAIVVGMIFLMMFV